MKYHLRSLIAVVTVTCFLLALGTALYRRATTQRQWLAVLEAYYGNQPWVAVRYRGKVELESPLERSLWFDALIPIEKVHLFSTFQTDDALERITSSISATSLELDDTDISERGFAAIARYPAIKEITVWHTDMSVASMESLLSIASLKKLHFKACRKEYDTFLAQRGDVEIIWQ